MASRLFVEEGRLEQFTTTLGAEEIIRLDENARGKAPPARVAISDWRSGKPDTECEIAGESIQWQADYCMMAMQTDDIVAADRCMRIESRTYHGEECARRRHFKQEWCRGVVDNGSMARTLAECIADPEVGGATVKGGLPR